MIRAQRLTTVTLAGSWTVVGDDHLPIPAVDEYLAFCAAVGRSPRTVEPRRCSACRSGASRRGPDGDPYLRFFSGKMAKEDMPNGYCARPLQTECTHPNFSVGSTQFAADVTFLPVLRGQRDRAERLEATCADEGRTRWAERNRKDVEALGRIIGALEVLPEAADFAP